MHKLTLHVVAILALSAAHAPSFAQVQPEFGGYLGADVSVVCPTRDGDRPMFRNAATGRTYPIGDPHLRAVAAKACEPIPVTGTVATTVPVSVSNNRSNTLYVSFTQQDGTPAAINWTFNANCVTSGTGIAISPLQTCTATVPANVGSTRFCAAHDAPPANCWLAQTTLQTMVETTFVTVSQCYPPGQPCVYYDISVIPQNCTDAAWASNQCAGTGGVAYNLPVSIGCDGTPTFACMGPANNTWGPELYPSNCGNPNGTCVGTGANCVNAYFFPMFSGVPATHQPTGGCFKGKTLDIVWLSGS